MQRYFFLGTLISGLLLMFYLYLLHFNDYSETELVRVSYYWLPLIIFGLSGTLAISKEDRGEYLKMGNTPIAYALIRTVIGLSLMILFFELIFPGL
ncbi:MAG: hypothetical protein KTR30_17950 [Saprospiraceae bacterium]|nr:hypothetical protein [Saprospiraceae bacterium]